jgi:hypothetical protein
VPKPTDGTIQSNEQGIEFIQAVNEHIGYTHVGNENKQGDGKVFSERRFLFAVDHKQNEHHLCNH